MQKIQKIEISAKTMVFFVFFLVLLRLVWLVKDMIFSLFIAFIIMSAIKPAVSFFEKKRIPRSLTTVVLFAGAFFFIGYLLSWIFPPFINETALFLKNLPKMVDGVNPNIINYLNIGSFSQYFPNITNQAFNIVRGVFSNAVFLFSTIVFSVYFTIEERFIKKFLIKFINEEKSEIIASIFDRVEKRMSAWFWGELILMVVVGLVSYIGLSLIGVKYALPLAIIAGLLEVVPNIGPVIATVPAFLAALTQSYFLGFPTIALYFVVQQLENHLIVPLIMKKAVGLNPIITLVALLIGGRTAGVLGILLAVPTTLFIEVVLIEIGRLKKI